MVRVSAARAFSLVLAALLTGAVSAECADVRVGLLRYFRAVRQVTLSAAPSLEVSNLSEATLASFRAGESAVVTADGGQLLLEVPGEGPVRTRGPLVFRGSEEDSTIRIEAPGRSQRVYRGRLEIDSSGEFLLAVNVVEMEDYLLGVVPAEMPPSFPFEALKAQAVAARSYAEARRGRCSSPRFELCDTNHCQIYAGQLAEHPNTTRAVRETNGLILVHNGRPAEALYCADCGGATRPRHETNTNSPFPYLCGVREPTEVEHASWEKTLSAAQLRERLKKGGVALAGEIVDVQVSRTDSSGRALTIDLITNPEAIQLSADRLRAALGADLPSTKFTVERTAEGSFLLKGRGSGHGYGMCQQGAKSLALSPFNYTFDRILAHYYPGTQLLRK